MAGNRKTLKALGHLRSMILAQFGEVSSGGCIRKERKEKIGGMQASRAF